MPDSLAQPGISCWPHRLAVLLACATFPLVWVGGLVTTTDAGMAVPDWPTTYGYNMFLYPWQTWVYGPWDLFIEHGHRLLASAVGLLTILLLVAVWRTGQPRWLLWLTFAALLLVIAQGVLGGMRVVLNERLLAMLHGCTGPLFFAVTVALAVCTSRKWRAGKPLELVAEGRAQRSTTTLHVLALLTCGLLYLQLGLGAFLRHVPDGAGPGTFAVIVQFHLLLAGLLLLEIVVLLVQVLWHYRQQGPLRNLSLLLTLFIVVQIALGGATWAVKYSLPQWAANLLPAQTYTIEAGSWLQTHVITAHVATGSLLLATSLALVLYAWRLVPWTRGASVSLPSRMELAV